MKRLLSLDFFRGLTIAGMIIVNDPGSWSYVYAPLRHAEWNGATPTDLVIPYQLTKKQGPGLRGPSFSKMFG